MSSQTLDLSDFFVNSSEISPAMTSASVPVNPKSFVDQIFLMGHIRGGASVLTPLLLSIERDSDDSFLVSDDLFSVYGSGNTEKEAIDDYVVSLIDYYELFAAEAARNVAALPQLQKLQRYLRIDAVQAA